MIENCPIYSMDVKVLLFWALIRQHNYRRYVITIPFALLNLCQWLHICNSLSAPLDTIIFSSYFSILFFSALSRTFLIISKCVRFEKFLEWIAERYNEISNTNNLELLDMLNYYTRLTKRFSIINYSLAFMMSFTFVANPLVKFKRILPYEILIPGGLNVTVTPYYEVLYTYQVVVTIFGGFYYIPYSNIFVAFISFGLVQVKVLQYKLERVGFNRSDTSNSIENDLKQCVKLHNEIYNYINNVNELFSVMSFVEFICFGIFLCALLFLIASVGSIPQVLLILSYICLVLVQLFTFYYASDKLLETGYNVTFAAYSSNWYTFDKMNKKIVYLIILRSQKPLQIMIGNIYPMTLVKFQAILNTSYSYFTILKKFK